MQFTYLPVRSKPFAPERINKTKKSFYTSIYNNYYIKIMRESPAKISQMNRLIKIELLLVGLLEFFCLWKVF